MSQHFADRLLERSAKLRAPVCVGLDPILDQIPPAATRALNGVLNPADLDQALDAVHDFCRETLQIVAPLVPVVKLQSAYFERYCWEGVELYYELLQEARDLGLMTIGDVKRGDIGSTSQAYADAHLANLQFTQTEHVCTPDAITINPMLGLDSIEPFVDAARELNKGLFVLVRTSNPGSTPLQDARLADGRTWSELLADSLAPAATSTGVGTLQYSRLGAVVGATQTATMASLRQRLPESIFLLPGYGTQGATADMTRAAFKEGRGAIVSASRSILYAHRTPENAGRDWKQCVHEAARQLIDDVRAVLE